MTTCPWEPLVVEAGTSGSEAGGGGGVSGSCHWAVTPPWLAEIVTIMLVVTGLVGMGNEVPMSPSGIVTVAGTVAVGGLLERLTSTPPGPAKPAPASSTLPSIVAPPVAFTPDCRVSVLMVGGI